MLLNLGLVYGATALAASRRVGKSSSSSRTELFRETEALGLAPQVPEGEGVKGVDRQSLRTVQAQQADDAVLHLDRRLPGKGHGQDPARIDALPNQMHKAHGQGGRLARAGSWP